MYDNLMGMDDNCNGNGNENLIDNNLKGIEINSNGNGNGRYKYW